MKRKGPKDIPDFSRNRPLSRSASPEEQPKGGRVNKPAQTPNPQVKPQTTSAKSGRRGQ